MSEKNASVDLKQAIELIYEARMCFESVVHLSENSMDIRKKQITDTAKAGYDDLDGALKCLGETP
jgi:hypothetical protein